MPSIEDSTWSNEILSSIKPKALFSNSVISRLVNGLSLAKTNASICGIRLVISIKPQPLKGLLDFYCPITVKYFFDLIKSSIIIPRRRKYTHAVVDENAVINISKLIKQQMGKTFATLSSLMNRVLIPAMLPLHLRSQSIL